MQPPGSPATEPLALRVLREIVRAGLALIVAFFVSLAVLALVPALQEVFSHTFAQDQPEKSSPRTVVIFVMLALSLAGGLARLGRRLSCRVLGIGYLGAALVLFYLANDSAKLTRPFPMEQFSPVFPGAETSFEVLMRYGKRHPAGRDFDASKLMTWVGFDPQKPEPWIKFVTDNRAAIEAEWQALAPARAWWTELNTFERIGDLTPAGFDAEILAFRPVRQLSQRACAMATLLALDGQGDEAMALLVPLIDVARKLQPSARPLVHFMIAIVIERMAMETAGFVLDRAPISAAMRARLAVVLSRPGGGANGARRIILCEYASAVNYYVDRPLGDSIDVVEKVPLIRGALNFISPFVYNRRTTMNHYAAFTTDVEELLARRELEKLEPREKQLHERDARPGFKNLGGALLVHQWVPAFSRTATSYWKTQDLRATLLARVAAP